MADEKTKLAVIDGETLMDMKLPPTKFCVDTLLPQGLCILGGASKIGKSWWVLDLCVRIAKGEPMWDLKTTGGTTLYLCLEDTLRRVQNRLLCITDEVPPNAFFATSAGTLSDGLCEQIRDFVKEHPDTVFVAVDTFQIVRNNSIDTSYANDYEEIRILKQLADELSLPSAGASPAQTGRQRSVQQADRHHRNRRRSGYRFRAGQEPPQCRQRHPLLHRS